MKRKREEKRREEKRREEKRREEKRREEKRRGESKALGTHESKARFERDFECGEERFEKGQSVVA